MAENLERSSQWPKGQDASRRRSIGSQGSLGVVRTEATSTLTGWRGSMDAPHPCKWWARGWRVSRSGLKIIEAVQASLSSRCRNGAYKVTIKACLRHQCRDRASEARVRTRLLRGLRRYDRPTSVSAFSENGCCRLDRRVGSDLAKGPHRFRR